MRIRAWLVTGSGALLAGTAGGILVAANDPATAEPVVLWLFWLALALTVWGTLVTALLLMRMNMGQAVWVGLALASAGVGTLALWQAGQRDARLLGGIIFATLCLSFFTWYRMRGPDHG